MLFLNGFLIVEILKIFDISVIFLENLLQKVQLLIKKV